MVYDEGRRISRIVGGLMLLTLGAVFLLQNFGVLHAGRVGDYWPLLLVWVGLSRMIGGTRGRHHFASGVVILALGVAFQLDRLGIVWIHARDFWPLLLVVAGVALVAESVMGRARPQPDSFAGPSSPGASGRGDRT